MNPETSGDIPRRAAAGRAFDNARANAGTARLARHLHAISPW